MDWGNKAEQAGTYSGSYPTPFNPPAKDVFDEIKIGLAPPEQVRSWSFGEVKKPETINYRTLKPEKEGLFDERIFGPQKDWECACGKYKRVRYRGITCEKCNVEVTRSKVRRERMGHIELAAPVTHIWFFKGVPSRLGYLLDMSPKELEKVIYFAAYVVTELDERKRLTDLPELEERMETEMELEREEFEEWRDGRLKRHEEEIRRMEEGGAKPAEINARLREVEREIADREERCERECELYREAFEAFRGLKPKMLVESEQLWRMLYDQYGDYFSGGMGAEAVKTLLRRIDLDAEMEMLRENLVATSAQRRHRATQRIKVVKPFWEGKHSPRSMIVESVPVIPPDLRPMVQLDGGRFATSDLNDLYRRVINRNNRLKRLLDLNAPEIIVNNEKRMLQEAVDALFDNGRRGKAVTGQGNRPLKSLTDMLKGKQGRFRQNLLGKRVDYSGRSVIVVGPQLKLHQCGLPKVMALELFKPFVMKRLVDRDITQNIKSAKRMVERRRPQVWDVLKEVIREHPVLLNRAPTLHRLGIQAFEPILVEGKAIQIHPLVCEAFNADFDGDQMAVHLPLSAEAQAEARILMISTNNVLSPASGFPVVAPSQDMVIGIYYLSEKVDDAQGAGRVFVDPDEAHMAYDLGEIALHAPIKVRMGRLAGDPEVHAKLRDFIPDLITENPVDGDALFETTIGRIMLNEAMPDGFPVLDSVILKGPLKSLIAEIIEQFGKNEVQKTLDGLKELGFEYSTRSGLTMGLRDVRAPKDKERILGRHQKKADGIDRQYQRGIITQEELHQELIEIWTEATEEVTASMEKALATDSFNPIDMMVKSGARGNRMQVRQIAGMRGLVANPKGDIIPRPIKANFLEGLTVLEYFISTHGARKGLADTALRTADSGYLTRRLVDVSQEIIVREEESEDRGINIPIRVPGPGGWNLIPNLRNRVYGRVLVDDVLVDDRPVVTKDGRELVAGEVLDRYGLVALEGATEVKRVRVRSPLTDEISHGISQASYGLSMATGRMVEPGEAVGIMAAQSIGEPGTQLTMRTFHTGGVAGQDITHGLPRVVELFEARSPKGKAILSEVGGRIRIDETDDGGRAIVVESSDDETSYKVSRRARLTVREGQEISPGTALTEGPLDPKEVCEIQGIRACQHYLVEQVQEVYRNQGVDIHDKHIELIVRQMLRKVRVVSTNDSDFLPHQLVDSTEFREENRRLVAENKRPAEGRPELMGITKASLATDSWLSAASFQETTRVLTEAAINGRSDYLRGLKENVIIGKLIPAGTGASRYQAVHPDLPDAATLPSNLGADWLASLEMPGEEPNGEPTESTVVPHLQSQVEEAFKSGSDETTESAEEESVPAS